MLFWWRGGSFLAKAGAMQKLALARGAIAGEVGRVGGPSLHLLRPKVGTLWAQGPKRAPLRSYKALKALIRPLRA